jgi:hypothetical protein
MDGLGGGKKNQKKNHMLSFLSFFLSTKSASFFQHKFIVYAGQKGIR